MAGGRQWAGIEQRIRMEEIDIEENDKSIEDIYYDIGGQVDNLLHHCMK